MTFPSREAYREYWRAHPALGSIWGPEVEAFSTAPRSGSPPELRSSSRVEAMRVDGTSHDPLLMEVAGATAVAAAVSRQLGEC